MKFQCLRKLCYETAFIMKLRSKKKKKRNFGVNKRILLIRKKIS